MNPELERKGWKYVCFWTKEDSAISEALFKSGVEVSEYAVFDHDPIEKAYELGRKDKLEEMRPLLEDTVKFLQRKS
jgi:hypothetical protein